MGLGRALFSHDQKRVTEPETVLLDGDPVVEVRLKPSARSRRLSLRVSRLDGRVTLTTPHGIKRTEAEGFLTEKAPWIRSHLSAVPREIRPMPGGRILLGGKALDIVPAPQRRVSLGEGVILVPETRPDGTPARLAAFLKILARERLVEASEHFAARIGHRVNKVTLRDTRSRWGSCSHEGHLMYSWRLIMAPPAVLDYVAAHEVAHMVHMDHSDRFWGVVDDLYPGHKAQRQWLRTQGGELHRFQFRN